MAVSAASAMSLKRSISSLDLAPLARAARARRSAQPSNKEGLEDPTLETPLKDTGLPPSPPLPPIDGRTLSDLELLLTIATTGDGAWRRSSDSATRRLHSGVNDLGPLRCGQVTAKMCIWFPWCARRCRAKPEGGEVDQVDGQQTLAGIGQSKQEQDQELPPAKGWKKYDTTYWEQEGCRLAHRLANRLAMPCPRHREAGRRAGPHQYLSKPFHCGCCVGTCELCFPSLSAASGVCRSQWSP